MPALTKEQVLAAREMRAAGHSLRAIAAVFGVWHHTVNYTLNAEIRAKRLAWQREWAKSHRRSREQEKINRLRREARVEAASTGEPVLDVYRRWECTLPSDMDPSCPPRILISSLGQPSI